MARFYQFQYHFIKQRLAVPLRFFSRTRDNVDRWYIRVIKATHYHGQYSINQYSNHNNIERLNRLHCVRDTCHCLNIFQRGNYVDSQEIRIAKFMSQRWITFWNAYKPCNILDIYYCGKVSKSIDTLSKQMRSLGFKYCR